MKHKSCYFKLKYGVTRSITFWMVFHEWSQSTTLRKFVNCSISTRTLVFYKALNFSKFMMNNPKRDGADRAAVLWRFEIFSFLLSKRLQNNRIFADLQLCLKRSGHQNFYNIIIANPHCMSANLQIDWTNYGNNIDYRKYRKRKVMKKVRHSFPRVKPWLSMFAMSTTAKCPIRVIWRHEGSFGVCRAAIN